MSDYYDGDTFVDRYAERFKLNLDKDWSYRECRLFILQKFLNGSIYDNLEPFWREYTDNSDSGTYRPLSSRRPSVIYKLPQIITNSSVSMLFGDNHFPVVRCDHEETTNFLQYITRACNLKATMIDAAKKGSIGSVVVLVKLLEGKFYFEAIHSIHCFPVFKQNEPGVLQSIKERKKVDGATLKTKGYFVPEDDLKKMFFLEREWTENEEIYYLPFLDQKDDEDFFPVIDQSKTFVHGLGFVPAIWIKNLPKSGGIDGQSTFEDAIDICIEIDYQLSQHGRLLKYNSDPTLVIKNADTLSGTELTKGIGGLMLDKEGEAYYLEITNGATKSVMEYVTKLRELALEMVRGNRSNPDKMRAAQSGEALKMLNFELVSLVEEMRITYGNEGLQKVYEMVLKIAGSDNIILNIDENVKIPKADCASHLILDWPAWYPTSNQDKLSEANTLTTLINNKIISQETAIKTIADEYNILDIDQEQKAIAKQNDNMYDKETITKDSVEPKPENLDS